MSRCKLPNCPVAKDGRCLENRGPSCPNLIPDAETSASAELRAPGVGPEPSPQPIFEPLPGKSPLDVPGARFFSRRGRAIVVALAGMPECGKTSLLARLHQMFQGGPVGGFDFAGSRSLPPFEELNWLATVESGVSQPRMPHSSAQFDNCFLHLTVRPTDGGKHVDLLLNDIAGETFKNAVEAQPACEKLVALARADHLVVLVDGASLAQAVRHHHVSQTDDFLQRVLQSGQCGPATALHVVVSKLDCLGQNTAVAEKLEIYIGAKFQRQFGSIDFWRVAARPMDGSLPTVKPLSKLFAKWAQVTHRYPMPPPPRATPESWARDFCRHGT